MLKFKNNITKYTC